jgi:hypothetical protein
MAVASAGDVDGDGFADVLVGRPQWGSVGIYRGSATGIAGTATQWASGTVIPPGTQIDFFGAAASSAGDVDGDGLSDIIVGASAMFTKIAPGSASVYWGTPTGLATWAPSTLTGPVAGSGFGSAVFGATN